MCLPESTVQCFLDQELSVDSLKTVKAHVNSCSKCDCAVIKAKEEAAIVQFALGFEMAEPVPTAKLLARIQAAISAAST